MENEENELLPLGSYPRKTLHELSKSDADNTYFISDEEHKAIDFDKYTRTYIDRYQEREEKNGVVPKPFPHTPSTLDALIPRQCGTSDRRYIFLEFKNCPVIKRDKNTGQLRLASNKIQENITYKLYDTAILMHVMGHAGIPTGYARMYAYIICSVEKNPDYVDFTKSNKQSSRFNAVLGMSGGNDELMVGLDESEVGAFKPKLAKHLEKYLYAGIRFITEQNLDFVMKDQEERNY